MTRLVQIFDRPCCGRSVAAGLAEFLQERVDDDVKVEYHNLSSAAGVERVRAPCALISHLIAGGPLPVVIVDGILASAGSAPDPLDALDLVRGTRGALTVTLPTGPNDGPASGCCEP